VRAPRSTSVKLGAIDFVDWLGYRVDKPGADSHN
jgi:hypothetical protein